MSANGQRFVVFAGFALLALLPWTTACENAEDTNIEQARQCLNSASQLATTNPALAAKVATNSCEPPIANDTTPEAGSIGVGVVLVEEQKLSNLQVLETAVSNGTAPLTTSISYLVFSTQAHVTNIGTYATRSQDPSVSQLANIVTFAFYANAAAGGALGPGTSPGALAGYLTTLSSDPTNGPPAAAALLSAQQNACASGSSSSLCTDLTNAIGTNTSSYSAILTSASNYINNE